MIKRIGKYEVVGELGSGATSTVYLALDHFNKQQVAIKLFNPDSWRDSITANAYRKLLLNEASLAGKLSHPYIVKIFDAELSGDLNYMVMEYIDGETLEQYTDADRLLPFNTVAELIFKCGKALEYAQQQGVIHRDIKPANIMLCGKNDIKVTDFGAALIENSRISQQLTQVAGIGSPSYMSPEQIQEQPLTHQTDIYSLGVTMYKLLTGKLPFQAINNYSLIYQIMHAEPRPPKAFRPDIPAELDAIVRRAIQRDLSKRYQTWGEFTNDLVHFFSSSVEVQEETFDTEKFDTLRSLDFFKNIGDTELWEVLRISEWREVVQDECILLEGVTNNSLFILLAGELKVMREGNVLDILHKGDCFGEMKRFPDGNLTRTTTVLAKTDATAIEIKLDVLAKASVECRFQFDDAFLYVLLKRLDVANTRISSLLSKEGDEVHG